MKYPKMREKKFLLTYGLYHGKPRKASFVDLYLKYQKEEFILQMKTPLVYLHKCIIYRKAVGLM